MLFQTYLTFFLVWKRRNLEQWQYRILKNFVRFFKMKIIK